jgi:hypothetical protein
MGDTYLSSGDMLVILTVVVGVAVSVWALMIGMALLFSKRAQMARDSFEEAPWRSFFIGLAAGIATSIVGIVLIALPNPVTKLIGWGIISLFAAVAAIGAGGLGLLVSDRITRMEPGMSRFAALLKGSGFVVGAGMLPVFGWFAYMPVVVIISFGAGVQAIWRRRERQPAAVTAPSATTSTEAV